MPGRLSRRCRSAWNDTITTSEGVKMHTWMAVRRQSLRKMRKEVWSVIFLMAILEAIRIGAVEIVFAGKDGFPPPGPDAYGIAYNVGHFLSWLYCCLFMLIYTPLFSWWVSDSPADEDSSPTMVKVSRVLKDINMVLLPAAIGLCLITYVCHLVSTFIYVDAREVGSRRFPKNNRKNWLVRLMLLSGVFVSLAIGYGAFYILEITDLAHVKQIEYLIIVVPVQINMGILFTSLIQFKIEKRQAKKLLRARAAETEAAIAPEEKQALLDI